MLLLDTHVLVWTLEGSARRVGPRSRALLARAEADDAIRVSVISLFEIAALHTLGRLRLTPPLDEWFDAALADGRVRIAELTRAMAIAAGAISRDALPDPLDRLLVATARRMDATFVTADRRILDHASVAPGLHVHDVRR